MALQLNINTRTAIGGIEIPNPIIARFVPIPMWNTLNLRFEFQYAVLENEANYGRLDNVLYEKLVPQNVYEVLTDEQTEQGVEAQITGTIDVISKVILPKTLTKVISGLDVVYALYAQIDAIMPNQSAFVKNVFGYHLMSKELLSPYIGAENIDIRLDLA
jgi:hypothetical protein